MIYLITGLPGSGKTTAAMELGKILDSQGIRTAILDGDNIRKCWPSVGYSDCDREYNQFLICKLAFTLESLGLTPIVATIAPKRKHRTQYSTEERIGYGTYHIHMDRVFSKRNHEYPIYEPNIIPPEITGLDEFNWYLEKLQS